MQKVYPGSGAVQVVRGKGRSMRAAKTPAPGRSRAADECLHAECVPGRYPYTPALSSLRRRAVTTRGRPRGLCPPTASLSARLPLICIHRAASKRARSYREIRPEGHAGALAALPHVTELRSCPEPPARTAASFPTDWPRSPPTLSYKTTQISVRGALEAPCTAGLRQEAARAAPRLQPSSPGAAGQPPL